MLLLQLVHLLGQREARAKEPDAEVAAVLGQLKAGPELTPLSPPEATHHAGWAAHRLAPLWEPVGVLDDGTRPVGIVSKIS